MPLIAEHTDFVSVPVTDLDRSTAEGEGVAFHGETFDTGVCHTAHFSDPDGNVLMLHRRYAASESGSTH